VNKENILPILGASALVVAVFVAYAGNDTEEPTAHPPRCTGQVWEDKVRLEELFASRGLNEWEFVCAAGAIYAEYPAGGVEGEDVAIVEGDIALIRENMKSNAPVYVTRVSESDNRVLVTCRSEGQSLQCDAAAPE
jgi:hypothetical protein